MYLMLFFKRKDQRNESLVTDSLVNSQESIENNQEQLVNTKLYFSPAFEANLENRYYYQFLHNELPPLKENQVSISGVEIKQVGLEWHIIAFIRQTVAKGIKLSYMPLSLIGPNGEMLGRKNFDLSSVGYLPGNSSTPWLFVFGTSDKINGDIPSEGWILAFATAPKHRLDLAESWERILPQEEKDRLASLIDSLEPPKNDVNLYGLSGKLSEDGNLHITLFIRNGKSIDIQIDQLPLYVEDASGDVAAKGVFKLDDFTVKAYSSKPWTFIFPKEMIIKEGADFSRWRAFPPQ
jgi:accessory Sec system S-layer assembly protein